MQPQRLTKGDPDELMRVTVSPEYAESFQRAFPGVGRWDGNNFVYEARRGDIPHFEEGARRHKRLLDQYGSANHPRPYDHRPYRGSLEKVSEAKLRDSWRVQRADATPPAQKSPEATMQPPAYPPGQYPPYLSQTAPPPQQPLAGYPTPQPYSGYAQQYPQPQQWQGSPPPPYQYYQYPHQDQRSSWPMIQTYYDARAGKSLSRYWWLLAASVAAYLIIRFI